MRYENMSIDELLREAEYTDNELALTIADGSYEKGYQDKANEYTTPEDSDFPEVTDHEKFLNINYLYNAGPDDWIKKAPKRYVLNGFDEDANVYHNQICVHSSGGKDYTITIDHSAFGEDCLEIKHINGLKKAKHIAIEEAAKLCIAGKLNG